MSYPVSITTEEIQQALKIDLSRKLADKIGDYEVGVTEEKFIRDVLFYTFENVIYAEGQREVVDKTIEGFPEVVPQIKNVLFKVIEYMLENEQIGLYSGLVAMDNGEESLKDQNLIIEKILPPNAKTYVRNIRPMLTYTGGMNV